MPAEPLTLDNAREFGTINESPYGSWGSPISKARRDGRVAEGTRLLSEWVANTASRVRIPVSPPFCV
jgi:hypothetical protein